MEHRSINNILRSGCIYESESIKIIIRSFKLVFGSQVFVFVEERKMVIQDINSYYLNDTGYHELVWQIRTILRTFQKWRGQYATVVPKFL